jgi:quercetin dioxygenase-like cupin family protein
MKALKAASGGSRKSGMSIGIAENAGTTAHAHATGACGPIGAERPDPLPTLLHIDIAVGLAQAPDLWRPHARADAGRRATRLLATGSYEAWVVHGVDDAPAAVHDHGDSAGVVVVVEGEADLLDGHGRRSRTLARGDVAHVPAGTAHDVVPTAAGTTSIQVFSPPLATVGVYDPANGELVAVGAVDGAPAVHDASSFVRALDRAGRRPPPGRPAAWAAPRGL